MTDNEIATYLGNKGYTIIKSYLEKGELNRIKKELTVKPFIPKTSLARTTPFPIFRESKTKIFLPRFYGLENFGKPDAILLKNGENIDLKFEGNLREYQTEIINKWLKHTKNTGCGLIEASCGAGKTVLATKIISILKKKTLIIVHKEFLLRQWKERIEQFLPDARIGTIQGPKIDTEDKDIVIGMLQSLSMKDYSSDVFKQFGFTIVDECHHISAEVFSRVLFKAVSKHILGLSATMNRTDGLTPVFKMFMGNIAATWKRESQDNVSVKAIEYINNDVNYSNVELNFKGQTNYVKMISKICEFMPRTNFIIDVIADIWKNDTKQQIMVIGHRKDLLALVHNEIKARGIATVGYYIGGMKEKDLKITEGKNIVIATYQMAEEALDIKTLSTIVMITPKKNVEQAVGRILRSAGNKTVIDIVDQHSNFKRHWDLRRRWYNREKFKISYTTNTRYKNDDWDEIKNKKTKTRKQQEEPYKNLLNGECLI